MDELQIAAVRKFQKELNAGTVSLLLLSLLAASGQPLYGYQISKKLEGIASESLAIKQGTLYPVLRSMEEQGLLESKVEPSVAGPPRKYYSITTSGREALGEWIRVWSKTRDLVEGIVNGRRGR